MLRKATIVALTVAATTGVGLPLMPATAAETGSISGVAFEDNDRDGVRDAGEPARADDVIFLMTADGGTFLQSTRTDAAGTYAFSDLSNGAYLVQYSPSTWGTLRQTKVPTTSDVWPEAVVTLPGATHVHFGWRPITTSTAPQSTHVGPEGLRVESYTDAVDASRIHATLASSGALGAEAQSVTVRFGHGGTSSTSTSWQQLDGRYTNISSTSTTTYGSWLDDRGATLFHEYGHAWASYFAAAVQQDPELNGYLSARGIAGDPRIDSSYGWARRELVAEDFRQLLGSSVARARAQANSDLPPAAQVPGLKEYLTTSFREAPSPSTNEPTAPTPLTVTSPSATATKSGFVFTWEANCDARTTVSVLDSAGAVVRQVMESDTSAGTSQASWNKTASNGRKVRSGTYTVRVVARTAEGQTVSRSADFVVR